MRSTSPTRNTEGQPRAVPSSQRGHAIHDASPSNHGRSRRTRNTVRTSHKAPAPWNPSIIAHHGAGSPCRPISATIRQNARRAAYQCKGNQTGTALLAGISMSPRVEWIFSATRNALAAHLGHAQRDASSACRLSTGKSLDRRRLAVGPPHARDALTVVTPSTRRHHNLVGSGVSTTGGNVTTPPRMQS